jgi:hypothetical protein
MRIIKNILSKRAELKKETLNIGVEQILNSSYCFPEEYWHMILS